MSTQQKILLIYTGGTIGMTRDYDTGALKAFNFDQLVDHIPELSLLDCEIASYSFDDPIDSSEMNPSHWAHICQVIDGGYHVYDGFVVLHGSDTMSYTASAISFMLENLAKPVIFTGSQLPIGDLRTDAKENLITAVQLAALQQRGLPVIREVGLYFEYKLYRANRTAKMSAEHFEAFDSPNYPALITSGVYLKINELALLKPRRKTLKVHYQLVTDIVLLKMYPGISEGLVRTMLTAPQTKGVLLETYGAGNVPTLPWLIEVLKETIKKGIPVVNVTQCARGSVQMGAYATSVGLKKVGVINGADMTTEAALAKMMYLLGQNLSMKVFKQVFETAIRGELS